MEQKPRIAGLPPRPTAMMMMMTGKAAGGQDYVMAGTGSPPLASVDSSVPGGVTGAAAAGQQAKVPAFLNKLFRCVFGSLPSYLMCVDVDSWIWIA